jgi:hypothetical protein
MFDYLTALSHGGSLETEFVPGFNVNFPAFDLKVVNNTKQTLFFSETLIDVVSSKLDPTPLLFVAVADPLHFSFFNDGWAPIETCSVRFSIKDSPWKKRPETYAFERNFGRFAETLDVDVSPELERVGSFDQREV